MLDNIPNAKTVTIKLSRGEVCKLLIGLNVLLENAVEGSVTFAAIRSKVKAQLNEHDAKEAAKRDK